MLPLWGQLADLHIQTNSTYIFKIAFTWQIQGTAMTSKLCSQLSLRADHKTQTPETALTVGQDWALVIKSS